MGPTEPGVSLHLHEGISERALKTVACIPLARLPLAQSQRSFTEGTCASPPWTDSSSMREVRRGPTGPLDPLPAQHIRSVCTAQPKGRTAGLAPSGRENLERGSTVPMPPFAPTSLTPPLACFPPGCHYDTFYEPVKSLMMPGCAAGLRLNPQQ